MSDKTFKQLVQVHGDQVTDAFLLDWCAILEQKPIFDATDSGWIMLFSQGMPMEFRQGLLARLNAQSEKPYGCVLCCEKPATKYHPCAGKVCMDCHAMLPKE
jgi:hypothetical protein